MKSNQISIFHISITEKKMENELSKYLRPKKKKKQEYLEICFQRDRIIRKTKILFLKSIYKVGQNCNLNRVGQTLKTSRYATTATGDSLIWKACLLKVAQWRKEGPSTLLSEVRILCRASKTLEITGD